MTIRPPAFEKLVDALSRFPSIGPKTAARIALWLLHQPREECERIAKAISEARGAIKKCRICFQYAEEELCPVCSDSTRDRSTLCVVEEAVDVWSFERTGRYRGIYHVLGGAISPLDGIGPDELNIDALRRRIADPSQGIKEVILATDPDTEGSATALYIADQLGGARDSMERVRISRLAHGLPVGGELAYSDDATLAEALSGRRQL